MWLDWLIFCDYGFSVSALWCPLGTPTILLGFLLPWMWGISSWLLQQSTAAAPYLGQGVSPHHRPSRPWTWTSSSRPSSTRAATAPWTWGCSSWPLPPFWRLLLPQISQQKGEQSFCKGCRQSWNTFTECSQWISLLCWALKLPRSWQLRSKGRRREHRTGTASGLCPPGWLPDVPGSRGQ